MITLFKDENESNRNYIYRVIKENIIEFYFNPEDKLSEPSIAKILNTSRTPVREALILLENEGLVEVKPQKGTFISKIDSLDIENMIFIRKGVEKDVIRLACKRISQHYLEKLEEHLQIQKIILETDFQKDIIYQIDNAFHKLLYTAVGAEKAWQTIEANSSSFNRLRKLDVMDQTSTNRRMSEHFELMEIIKEKKVDEIDSFIDHHLDAIDSTLPLLKQRHPNFFK